MAKLLYSAKTADGQATQGFVEADSAAGARAALLARGLSEVVLHQEPAAAQEEWALKGLDETQLKSLARAQLEAMRAPTMTTAMVQTARGWKLGLAVAAAVLAWGLWSGKPWWIAWGLALLALPFALTAWGWRHAGRYLRLIQSYSVGDWAAARKLIEALRPIAVDKPQMGFDLDVRLAAIKAREGAPLDRALAVVQPWQQRLAAQPGLYESRVAGVHYAAGDEGGYLRCMDRASELMPGDPSRTLDAALAHARSGDLDRAQALFAGVDASLLPPHGLAFVDWSRGLIEQRRGEPQAAATLGRAAERLLDMAAQPAVWTALGVAMADFALALAEAGRRDEARSAVERVWPIARAHLAQRHLQRLEAAGLAPTEPRKN